MTAHCHSLPLDSAAELLQLAARAICVRPGETASQGAARTRQLTHTAMGFEPRDGLEYILAILVFGHFNLILDSMSAAFQGETEAVKTRAKSGIVALDRAMLATLRALRLQRKRPVAEAPVRAPAQTPAHGEAEGTAQGEAEGTARGEAQTEVQRQAHGEAKIPAKPAATPEPPRRPAPPRASPDPLPGLPGQRPPLEDIAPRAPMPGPRHAALASTCLASGLYAATPQARAPAPDWPMETAAA